MQGYSDDIPMAAPMNALAYDILSRARAGHLKDQWRGSRERLTVVADELKNGGLKGQSPMTQAMAD